MTPPKSKLLVNRPRRNYCSIQSCVNHKGSSTREYTFFRPPPDRCTHDKWKEAIGQYQQAGHLSLICELHFQPEDVISSDYNKTRRLKTGSIPSIFGPNSRAIKIEPTSDKEPVQYIDRKVFDVNNIEQRSNGYDSMALQDLGVHELYQKLELQTRLTEYWKSIALKYEPNHADPMWSFNPTEKVTTELLEAPPPASDKVFKPYQCATCNECFEKPGELETHIHIEHEGRKRQSIETIKKCIVCCKFLGQYETGQHLCTGLNQIVCEYCHKEYKTTSGILRHLHAVHGTKTIYKCARCPQEFGMNLLMTIHNECHEKEGQEAQNRFKCTACSIVFKFAANLERHKTNHCPFNKNGGTQLCQLCGSGFQHIDEFKQHMQEHNRLACSICSQIFKTNFSLKKHYERHHGSAAVTQMDTECENS